MNELFHLFSPQYILNRNLGPFTSNLAWFFVYGLVGLIILAIILKKLAKKRDKFTKRAAAKYSALAWTMGMIGIILWAFRQINVFYLSAPVLLVVWLAIVLVWLGFILHYVFVRAPRRRREIARQAQNRIYSP